MTKRGTMAYGDRPAAGQSPCRSGLRTFTHNLTGSPSQIPVHKFRCVAVMSGLAPIPLGGAYSIAYHRGQWVATRNDTHEGQTALSAEELRDKIREDYRKRPVPRNG